jgi:hypothetical protein
MVDTGRRRRQAAALAALSLAQPTETRQGRAEDLTA